MKHVQLLRPVCGLQRMSTMARAALSNRLEHNQMFKAMNKDKDVVECIKSLV